MLTGDSIVLSFTTLSREVLQLPSGDAGAPDTPGAYIRPALMSAPMRPGAVRAAHIPHRVYCYMGYPCNPPTGVIAAPGPLIAMKLEREGPTTISSDGYYTEDTTIRVTAVDSHGAIVPSFSGVVNIAGKETIIYSQNGGSLPSEVTISGGTATLVAKSLAGPRGPGLEPADARITVLNYPVYNSDLLIPQWITSGQTIDPKASGPVYDGVQKRAKDIREAGIG